MRVCVSRFADDTPVPGPDTPTDRVVFLSLGDRTSQFEFFVFFEDRARARIRKFYVLQPEDLPPESEDFFLPRLQCYSDRLATESEITEAEERFRKIDAVAAETKLANSVLQERWQD